MTKNLLLVIALLFSVGGLSACGHLHGKEHHNGHSCGHGKHDGDTCEHKGDKHSCSLKGDKCGSCGHKKMHMKMTAEQHTMMAEAHQKVAKCLEEEKDQKDCMAPFKEAHEKMGFKKDGKKGCSPR